ncbi:hypothetical protein ACI2K4_29165 [Micromonospora sp. NPDC050397]|uniref:hypothetical protein n=1 Tax=Micromonospora sp. NPDC050397 TaxID=3364279 RepID=UPI00384B7ED9
MRVRITLRVAPRDRDGVRLSAEQLHDEEARIFDELSVAEDRGAVQNLWTEVDAEGGSITAEVIVPFDYESVAISGFTALLVAAMGAADKHSPQLPWPVDYIIHDSRAQPTGLEQGE